MLTCSICCETNGVEMINVNIGKGRIQKIPYCKRHAKYLQKDPHQIEKVDEEKNVMWCCGRPVNQKTGRCSRCGDRYN
jgi:hypothetical protein